MYLSMETCLLYTSVSGIGLLISPSYFLMISIAGLVFGLLLAILAVKQEELVAVSVTAISGGLMIGSAASWFIQGRIGLLTWVITVLLAVLGMVVQFMMHSRKMGRKEKIHSEKFREAVSMESEVEKARMVLDDELAGDADEDDDELSLIHISIRTGSGSSLCIQQH